MKTISLQFLSSIMRLVFAFMKPVRVRRKVSFLSRQSNSPSADIMMLEKMVKDTCDDVETVILTKMIEGHLISYPFHILRQLYHIASSRLVIIDGYCIPVSVLDLKKDTKVIQIWHAQTAVKKFGKQTLGKPSGSSPAVAEIMRMHRNYDYVIAPSRGTARYFSEGMGTDISRFVYAYMPHTLKLMEEADNVRPKMRETLGLNDSKKTILYAPTFRKGAKVPANELFQCVDKTKYDFVFRPHPIDTDLEILDPDMNVDMDSSIYDLITAADIVITDYSSIMVETLLMKKNMFVFAYDIDSYREDPGLNIDPGDGICGRYFFTKPEELPRLLEQVYDEEEIRPLRDLLIDEDVPLSNERLEELIKEILK